jgi:hypothetical protein
MLFLLVRKKAGPKFQYCECPVVQRQNSTCSGITLVSFNRSSASGCEHHDAHKHHKDDCHDADPDYRGDKSVSAMWANPYVQANGLLAGGASFHCGESILDRW